MTKSLDQQISEICDQLDQVVKALNKELDQIDKNLDELHQRLGVPRVSKVSK
jgi:ABC-type transporter Mla subunit MlaD